MKDHDRRLGRLEASQAADGDTSAADAAFAELAALLDNAATAKAAGNLSVADAEVIAIAAGHPA